MMRSLKKLIFVFVVLYITPAKSQQVTLPVPVNIQKAFNKGTRDKSGLPGYKYWQNKADYSIKVNFIPTTRRLSGTVSIDYFNNSPDTLRRVLFKLYSNLYQKEAMRATQIAAKDLSDGINIESVSCDQKGIDSANRIIKGTNMNVRGVKIPPHGMVNFQIAYSYNLNKGSFIRTGQVDSGAFFIAYFFPRITVYDDIDGWNEYPYTGPYEFYNDYGHFKAEITVPADYQVWGTGDLKNAEEVYQPRFSNLIRQAEKNDAVTDIITEADLKAGGITKGAQLNTWKFEAEEVTDIAFGISNHYVWKASSLIVDPNTGRRSRTDAVYNPDHKSYIPVINYARKATEAISYKFPGIPFPYPHITIFDGLDAMEYPMMVNDLPFEKQQEAVEFTAHEIFHSLFPFYVGTNETKYSFMDEGWATLAESILPPMIDSTIAVVNNVNEVNKAAGTEQDLPVMTLTPQLLGAARYADKDMKPALGYLYVKEMLGEQVFLKALKYYIAQWHGRHPTPYDFFNCMNAAAGTNLNWFWNNWFFGKGVPDLAISNVAHQGQLYSLTITRVGEAMVPVHLTVFYKDGSQQLLRRSISCWKNGDKAIKVKFTGKNPVSEIVLGAAFDADSDKSNNTWRAK